MLTENTQVSKYPSQQKSRLQMATQISQIPLKQGLGRIRASIVIGVPIVVIMELVLASSFLS